MGIYIKGIEMPNPGHIVLVEIDENGDVFAAYDGGRTKLAQYKAVPVPPHGRLIDADKLEIRDAEKQAYEAYLREKGEDFIEEPIIEYHRGYLEGLTHASGLVRFAPTIIPASKEET